MGKKQGILKKVCPLCYKVYKSLKKKTSVLKNIEDGTATWNEIIQLTLKQGKIVIFSKENCEKSKKIKKKLADLEQTYTMVSINKLDENGQYETALSEFTNNNGKLPYVFINGKYYGNDLPLEIIHQEGMKEQVEEKLELVDVMLVHHVCSGMFWRNNPLNSSAKQKGNKEWPKNGSFLTGVVHEKILGEKWLEVKKWKQVNSIKWINCLNCWMPFQQHGQTILQALP